MSWRWTARRWSWSIRGKQMDEIAFYIAVMVVSVGLHYALRVLDGAVEGYMMRHLKEKEK
jgi:hypothetical protein